MGNKFAAVIFDMDGLMFDTERLSLEAWQVVGRENGLPITHELAMLVVGKGPESTKAVFETHLGPLPHFFELREQRLAIAQRIIETDGMPLKKGLKELMAFLKENNLLTALATASPRASAGYYLEKAELIDYFDQIVFGDMVENPKPAPDIYLQVCNRLGVAPQSCLTLEDSPVGIKAAYLAGTKPVMIPDLILPDESVEPMLFAKADSLLDVIPMFSAD